jgi:phosphoglycolate phosphatase-like HAD superfamily hydrolase
MQVLKKETTVFCDVDQTLVIWTKKYANPHTGAIKIIDPYTQDTLYLQPHKPHIRLLKQYKTRGYGVVVFSKAGYKWAEAVVKAVGLEPTVDLVMSKSDKYIDDKTDIQDILGCHVYLNPTND